LSERQVICAELDAALDDLAGQGYRLDVIYPADSPHTATLSRGDDVVRLTTRPDEPRPSDRMPPFVSEFLITRGGCGGAGRAGMHYRDLIPGRLGGRYIASLISLDGGLVADWVHYHRVAFQMIAVRSGWVRVVYEDQGEPFVMNAGDIVLQPPLIRHRVLESSPGLEVVEIGCPALHETFADHDMALPNRTIDRGRSFDGQRFLHHVASKGGPIGLEQATGGLASARLVTEAADFGAHEGELVFGFVLDGSSTLGFEGEHDLGPADAFVIPPCQPWRVGHGSPDFRLLLVTTARLD
jgi:quercetin dioxygenase-like cupin family protein